VDDADVFPDWDSRNERQQVDGWRIGHFCAAPLVLRMSLVDLRLLSAVGAPCRAGAPSAGAPAAQRS
jgi:hypothetical protein